jgi:hypothetical protein
VTHAVARSGAAEASGGSRRVAHAVLAVRLPLGPKMPNGDPNLSMHGTARCHCTCEGELTVVMADGGAIAGYVWPTTSWGRDP